jgi:heat shock protein HtpX
MPPADPSTPTRSGGGQRRGRQRPGGSGGRGRPVPARHREEVAPVLPPLEDDRRPAIAANRRRALLGTALPGAVVVAALLGAVPAGAPLLVMVVAAVVVAALTAVPWVFASKWLVRRVPAVPADEHDHARLHSVVEGVCLAAGLPRPELLVLADPAPNAISFGTSPADAVLVCTRGLLEQLDRIELEAVVAHELSHVRAGDTLSGGIAALTWGRFASGLAARMSGVARESLADQTAVSLTRYPPGLVSALGKLSGAPTNRPALDARFLRATNQLWLVPPVRREPSSRPVRGALDVDDRIALLREL